MSLLTPSPEFLALQRVVAGRYSLERELGRGGMGIVFLARDVALDRPVAIKLLPPAVADSTAVRDRFLREARTAARLSHPHIVPIHAVESHDELAFFVMGFIDGDTLGERVRRRGPMPPHDVMRIVQEVAWALAHAHAHGVIHRDVKPDNILLERGTGRAIVTDFGIAYFAGASTTTPQRGTIVGTPRYMSPEQAAGDVAGPRSDLYSLGITAYYALTGLHPFDGGSIGQMRLRQLALPRPALVDELPTTPRDLVVALERALARAPSDRFESAEAMAEALRTARGAEPAVAAPVRRFVADAEAAGGEIGTVLTAGAVAVGLQFVPPIGASGFLFGDLFSAVAYAAVTGLSVGLATIRTGQLAARARTLLAAGYSHGAARPAFAIAAHEAREERAAAGTRTTRRDAWATAGLGTVLTALALWASNAPTSAFLQFTGFAGSILVPTLAIRKLWTYARRTRPSLWNRLLAGPAGRWLFRVSGVGLRDRPAALPAAGEPTALALGRAADAVFDALPPEHRHALGEVPRLIHRLEEDAVALRARGNDPAAAERLATVVAALETLRLDLFRLHAGTVSRDELTANLDAVRRVGEEIDARLAAEAEVGQILGERERTPV